VVFPVIQNNLSLHVVFAYAIGLVIDCVVVLILCDRIGLFVCVFELCLLRFGNVFVFCCSRTALDCADPNPISCLPIVALVWGTRAS